MVTKLRSTRWLGFEALLGNKWTHKVDWTNCLNWISIAKLVVHCANECIFNIWINFPYSITLLLLYSLSSPHVVHLCSIVLQISIWSENKIANTSLVNEVQWLQVVWVCKHCKFYQCEKKVASWLCECRHYYELYECRSCETPASSAWKELQPHGENLSIVKLSHMNQSQYILFMLLSIKMYISWSFLLECHLHLTHLTAKCWCSY